ncbi:carbon-nitrogen hydrolase family protein [Nitrincola sp. MINF-07-Sa-05]|uniref:carbon-nitrogen hydrolase family protein n=1 Tax=Nitrincola salilacus TaxID=3400273 RepID=UPI003917B7B0
MQTFKIAVAQVPSNKGDVATNTATHLHAIKCASAQGVSCLVFPELSLTGYEPELASDLAFTHDDLRLQPFIDAAREYNISIGVGVPLATVQGIEIGLLFFSPAGEVTSYSKMHLHPGEDRYFSPGSEHHIETLHGVTIAHAICADTNQPQHARECAKAGAEVYIAGVMITAGGYEADTAALSRYASEHGMLVAMANHNASTGGWQPIGKSAIWTESGLLACANETQQALVVAEQTSQGWVGQVFEI